ncbi:MAG: hypothetical protein IPM52_08280 [Bacteroidetes bacterium]|nr:hypothetical protein [Bacteroidota bacterium]
MPPFVIIDGTFSIGPEGEIVWCPGDSLSFELGMPYNTNITWYRNGQPIPGAVSNVLKVTQDGSYSVSAAPEVCPDYIQWLGVPLEGDLLYNRDRRKACFRHTACRQG